MNRDKSALELKRIRNSELQREFKERHAAKGRTELRGVYATTDNKVKIKKYAKSIERQ